MNRQERNEECKRLQSKFLTLRASGLQHEIDESLVIEREYLRLRTDLMDEVIAETSNAVTSFNPQSLNNIVTEPTEIVCKDFLPLIKGAYNLIAGAGGVGKSTIALRSALHYLRSNPMDRALLVMGEDDKEEIMERLKFIVTTYLQGDQVDVDNYIARMDFVTVDNPSNMRFVEKENGSAKINTLLVNDFKKYIKDNGIGFVVLDPLKKFHSVDENSNSEMDLLVRDVFLELAGELKIVILLLHHSSKSKDGTGSRGASTISDTSRIAYRISKKYITDKESHEIIEDPDYIGKVRITTIKDNRNIFQKFGYRNTNNGIISLYGSQPEVVEYKEYTYDFPVVGE